MSNSSRVGASVKVSFQFGTTTAYGQSTAVQKTGPDNTGDQFSASLTGLPSATTIHYRAVAVSDFGTFVGANQTLTTTSTPQDSQRSRMMTKRSVVVSGAFLALFVCGNAGAVRDVQELRLDLQPQLRAHDLMLHALAPDPGTLTPR